MSNNPQPSASPSRGLTPDIARRLDDIDSHVEAVNIGSAKGSAVETLTYAIHNLIGCIRDLHSHA